ncbi:DUF2812 domain-containing protein [Ruminiclostridium cellulolyticum]|uniref:DUF2812 domain-containing protein n=1 Tax=Ruminiclostridium cellulolyticum (strain ATCC 35319 / DSM 5812 / JCM 6584 / H10) TaxID=394503 RepID=B8I033_RUMCH|nr:DUF2812 domain-containing protein [Ruminiclostridium cellulolyticum]ACL75533.1 hypothetical protein Ccel_1176 [Ruminiclostridium cellulolyticum H10]
MIKIFKWWWAWEYERIENWLEEMEASGLHLVKTRIKGLYFYFERCKPTKARYCVDYQSKLTSEYITLIRDDGWELYQIGMGWYILRKQYEDERPELYTDFESLIARNKALLTILLVATVLEVVSFGNMIWDIYNDSTKSMLPVVCIMGSLILAFFSFIITNVIMQITKFRRKQ